MANGCLQPFIEQSVKVYIWNVPPVRASVQMADY